MYDNNQPHSFDRLRTLQPHPSASSGFSNRTLLESSGLCCRTYRCHADEGSILSRFVNTVVIRFFAIAQKDRVGADSIPSFPRRRESIH
ncbi:MAG: hypothetical protein F9K23_06320 [Bacteroidetes bacterium]|nr:MAG: hypothetical protein F9K23_06320 [Bacteroidota bacterium]